MKLVQPLLILILSFIACEQNNINEFGLETTANAIVNINSAAKVFSANRPDQDPLNVVYFIPTDFVAAYESDKNNLTQRVGTAMLFAQEWYKKQMDFNGYSDKTFALFTKANNAQVMVLPVYGSKASTAYTNNAEVKSEVEAYFIANPNLKGGEHTMVFSDWGTGFNNASNGRMAFCRSIDNFDITQSGQYLDDLELLHWGTAGGCLHELGHALNSPHFAHVASENPNRSMMGGGGANRYNSGSDLNTVFLVEASAAIYDVSAAFNKNTNGITYYSVQPNIELISYTVEKDNATQTTLANFKFTSDVPAKYLYVGLDATPSNVNNDYDKITYTAAVTPTGNSNEYVASLSMPYSDFFNGYSSSPKINNDVEFSVNILTENGFRENVLSYYYTISSATSPEPNADINNELFAFSDRSGWTITANSTTPNGNRVAQNMLDADRDSFWYSDWPYRFNESGPHIIEVDLGSSQSFDGLYTYSLNSSNAQFRIKHALIEVSQDGTTYTQALDYTASSINDTTLKMMFESEVTAQYMRITVDEVFKSSANFADNLIINELDIIFD